jgi:hypothetical protein
VTNTLCSSYCMQPNVLYLFGFRIVSAYKLLEHLHQCSVCDPGNIVFISKFYYQPFSNPTPKTETGTGSRCETINSNPLGPIKLSTQSETTSNQEICFDCVN